MTAPGVEGDSAPVVADEDGPRTDRRLMADHVAGDPTAFAELVIRHRDRLWAVAVRTLGDHDEAADALQDALVSAYRGAAGFRGEAAVTTWLHRVVVNACLDRLRRRAARPTVPMPDAEPADRRDDHRATEIRIDVRAALATLPEHQRQALVLVDMHGLSVAEAAAVLQVAEGTIKSRCARGRAALAPLLRPVADAGNLTGSGDVTPMAPRHPPTSPHHDAEGLLP